MATDRRIERLNRTLMKEIGTIIMREVKDPRMLSMVSVLDAQISRDLEHLKVIVSIFGQNEKSNMKTLEALNSASGYISSVVSSSLRMRFAPEIEFVRSDSLGKAAEIYSMIKEENQGETDEEN